MPRSLIRTFALAAVVTAAACGGGDEDGPERAAPTSPDASGTSPEFRQALALAASPSRPDFPAVQGRTLRQLADSVTGGLQIGLATSVFTPGKNRLAFGLIDARSKLVYGKTAVYVAASEGDRAQGPFLAPADSLVTDPQFRSETAAAEADTIAAIYAAEIPIAKTGNLAVLAVTNASGRRYGAATTINVVEASPVVDVGEPAPRVATDTLASVGGDEELLCTRKPPDDMHDRSLDEVLGKRPVALLMATPALCESRVCGPVVDIALQLKQEFGDRVEFIHQEVFVDNEHSNPLRKPLQAFGLPTEPWLFTIDADGKVASRLEGSFGIESFRRAVTAAL